MPNSTNTTLALNILVQQRERNQAIGIKNDTQFVRGLGQFIQAQNREAVDEVATAAEALYIHALIKEYQAVAKKVTEYIMENIDEQEARTDGLRTMIAIESHVNYLGEKLEELWPT